MCYVGETKRTAAYHHSAFNEAPAILQVRDLLPAYAGDFQKIIVARVCDSW
jgi:hypothetical protein